MLDVLFHLPHAVIDRRHQSPIAEAPMDQLVTLRAIVVDRRAPPPRSRGLTLPAISLSSTGRSTPPPKLVNRPVNAIHKGSWMKASMAYPRQLARKPKSATCRSPKRLTMRPMTMVCVMMPSRPK